MGAPRVTPQEIIEMHRLYKSIGTYTGVGEKIGRSASTVAKYIKLQNVPVNVRLIVEKHLNGIK